MREYYRRYRDANASTEDFRKVMEEASGRNLGWFFDQWLLRAGSPSLEGTWTYNADSKKVLVDVAQTQTGTAFRLPIEIGIKVTGGPGRIEKVEMTDKTQHFEIASAQEPAGLELDPNTWVLAEAKLGKR